MAAGRIGSLPDAIKDKVLECGICKGILCEPRSLKCGHNFCLHCLEEDVKARPRNGGNYICPLCRKGMPLPTGGISQIGCNILIKNLLDVMEHHCAIDMCAVCKTSYPSKVCLTCEVKRLCRFCSTEHNAHVKDHQVVDVNDFLKGMYDDTIRQQQTSKCELHGQRMKYFCNKCTKPVCVECTTLGLCTHVESRCSIEEAGKLSGENLLKALEEVENKMSFLQSCEKQVSESSDRSNNSLLIEQKKIDLVCKRAIRSVIQRFTRQLSTMHTKHQDERKAADDQIKKEMKTLQETKKKIENLRKYATCEEKIMAEKNLIQEVAEIREICQVEVCKPYTPHFKPEPEYPQAEDITKLADLLGSIYENQGGECVLEIDTCFPDKGKYGTIYSLAVFPNNDIVCMDRENQRIKRFNDEGQFQGLFQDNKISTNLTSLGLLPNDNVMVICTPKEDPSRRKDVLADNIITLTTDGVAVGSRSFIDLPKYPIREMAVTSTGDIVTLDDGPDAQLKVYSQNGGLKSQLSNDETGKPYLVYAMTVNSKDEIIFTGRGGIFITDTEFKHVHRFVSEYVLETPFGVCVDKDDFIYIADFNSHTIIRLTPGGQFHKVVLTHEHDVQNPGLITFDNQGRLVVMIGQFFIKVFKIFPQS